MFTKEEIQDAILNSKLIAKKGLFPNTPGWDAFIAQTHCEFHNDQYPAPGPDYFYNPDETLINGINKRENFYLMVASRLESPFFPEQNPVLKALDEVMGYPAFGSASFLNFVGGEVPSNIHADPRYSFYWQCIGTSIWESHVDDGKYDIHNSIPIQSIVLEPGDVIFIPNTVLHTVRTPEPRAAITFGYYLPEEL